MIQNREVRTQVRSFYNAPAGVGRISEDGSGAAVRTVIRYRNGVLNGKGASLLDGYMEDLATDRIYRLMLAQRLRHADTVRIVDAGGAPVRHDEALLDLCFEEALAALVVRLPLARGGGARADVHEAARPK